MQVAEAVRIHRVCGYGVDVGGSRSVMTGVVVGACGMCAGIKKEGQKNRKHIKFIMVHIKKPLHSA